MEIVFPAQVADQWIDCPKGCPGQQGCRFRARITWDEYDVRDKHNKCWTYARNLVVELLKPEGSERCKPVWYILNPDYKFFMTDDEMLARHPEYETTEKIKEEIDARHLHREHHKDQRFSFKIEPGSEWVVVSSEDVIRQQQEDSDKQPAGTGNPPWDYQSWDKDFGKAPDKTKGTVFRLSTSPGVGFSEFTVRLAATGMCGCADRPKNSTDHTQVKGKDVTVDYKFEKKKCG